MEPSHIVQSTSRVLANLCPSIEDGAVATGAYNVLAERSLAALALTPQPVEGDFVFFEFQDFFEHNVAFLAVFFAVVAKSPLFDHHFAGQALEGLCHEASQSACGRGEI